MKIQARNLILNIPSLFIVIMLISCSNPPKNKPVENADKSSVKTETSYIWKKVLDSAEWTKSYNFQMFTINDTIWTFHPDGNWFSTDGIEWTKSPLINSINNLAFLKYVQFNNVIYGLGHFEGNIEQFNFTPEIYKTNNFKTWDIISKSSNLPERFFYHPFIFQNKIWFIGGEDKTKTYSDIWNSPDGIHWTMQKNDLPFGKRSRTQVVNLNNKLYLLGNDVWCSTDGLNWQKVSDEIVPGVTIFGYTAIIYDNKIWLLGCNRNGEFSSEVLYSADGENWFLQNAPWLPRGGIAATVFNNKIYISGGKYGGTQEHPEFRYDNDVWMMEKQ